MWSSRQSGCARVQREICRREDARTEITNALARGMMLQHGIFDLRPTHRLFHPWPGPEVFLCAACFSGSALAITVRASGTETPTGVADVDIVLDRVPHGASFNEIYRVARYERHLGRVLDLYLKFVTAWYTQEFAEVFFYHRPLPRNCSGWSLDVQLGRVGAERGRRLRCPRNTHGRPPSHFSRPRHR
jgi:hypothetical protein